MPPANITRTAFRVADFLTWQRNGQLDLSPAFQRRSVWNTSQKSFLIDTIVRGLPIPIVFIRDSLDLKSRTSVREMVDGQQRLRTLISFIDPLVLKNFEVERDAFTVRSIHNPEIADKPFSKLSSEIQTDILSYEISTHILPLTFSDRDVLQVFARMNSTGLKLNAQELRNAEYAGAFKTWAYELATEQLDRWRGFRIFSEEQIARMREVDFTSDLLMNMVDGLIGKTQPRIDKFYAANDETWVGAAEYAARFRSVLDVIEDILTPAPRNSAWRSEVNFFTLFVGIYDFMFVLGSSPSGQKSAPLPPNLQAQIAIVDERLRKGDIPADVLDATQRASADVGRRRTRLAFFKNAVTSG